MRNFANTSQVSPEAYFTEEKIIAGILAIFVPDVKKKKKSHAIT